MYKANVMTGKVVKEAQLPTGPNDLNVWYFNSCVLVLSGNRIGMIITRTMTIGEDGVNHQGGLAAVFDTDSLKMVKNHGQTTGHDFATSLLRRSDGMFMGMDLGDKFPKGVNCWNFDDK